MKRPRPSPISREGTRRSREMTAAPLGAGGSVNETSEVWDSSSCWGCCYRTRREGWLLFLSVFPKLLEFECFSHDAQQRKDVPEAFSQSRGLGKDECLRGQG